MHFIDSLRYLLTQKGIDTQKEYRFHDERRFRFDLALPDFMIAVEYEGGIFSNGGHNRGMIYHSNCEKYNLAAVHGWTVLRYTAKSKVTQALKDIEDIIHGVHHVLS